MYRYTSNSFRLCDHQNQIEKGRRITRAVEDWNDSSKSVKEQGQVNTQDMTMAHMVDSLLEVDDFSNEMVSLQWFMV